jgi:uncharacterized protein (TIGR00255 family)
MALSSMTGFARAEGHCASYTWAWELKSVNAKGLEIRLRLPPGWDAIEVSVRARAADSLSRGILYASLTLKREGVSAVIRLNEPVLAAILSAIRDVAHRIDASPPSLDGILGLKGVIEVSDEEEKPEERQAADAAVVESFVAALAGLCDMRCHEGDALGGVLAARLDDIERLTTQADAAPGRRAEAIKARLAQQVGVLLEATDRFDADRLHQEAILIASKADVREELDRLKAHVAQARKLIRTGGAVGRRLDFLAQELHREANTLCAKSNDIELTTIGL